MPVKSATKKCRKCGETLPRTSFAETPRTDASGVRLAAMCNGCQVVVDQWREVHRRAANTTVTCACGCGRYTNNAPTDNPERGWVAGEPMKYLLGHNMRTEAYPDQFYTVDPGTGCWLWNLGLDKDGYGRYWVGGQHHRAHRYFFEDRFGTLPEGYVPDHQCQNKNCVNPEHMSAATVEENSRWKSSTKLDLDDVTKIRSLVGTMTQQSIADMFSVSQAQIWRIINRKRWA